MCRDCGGIQFSFVVHILATMQGVGLDSLRDVFHSCWEVILSTQPLISHKLKHMLKHDQNLMVLILALGCFSV